MQEKAIERESEPAFGAGKRRFVFLLASFGLMFLFDALSSSLGYQGQSTFAKTAGFVVYVALLSAGALAASSERSTRMALRGFLAFVIVMLAAEKVYEDSSFLDYTSHVSIALFILWVTILIIRNVWGLEQANTEAIAAALCAFLMLGLLWSILYSLIDNLDPGAFGDVSMRIDGDDTQPGTARYFSYVTLTTLGFGDISPKTSGARMFTILEAIVGQVFLVVLVARLVGLSIATGTGDRDRVGRE